MAVQLTQDEKKRKTNREILCSSLEANVLDGSLSDVIRALTELASEYFDYDDLTIETDYYYDSMTLELIGHKQESDEAYSARIEKLKKQKAIWLAKEEKEEKKLMKALLKKYGKSV